MSVLLGNEELDALHGQIPELWQFYVVLKQVMDYRTGIVGHEVRISWRTICERLYIEPGQGLTGTGTPAKSKARRLAERAERAGLVIDQSQEKQLVFFLPLAKRDFSAPNKPGTNPAQTRHTIPAHKETSNQAGLFGESDQNPAHQQSEETPKTRQDIRSPYSEEESMCAAAHPAAPRTARFDEFWGAWPKYQRKTGKKKAQDIWKRKALDSKADIIIANVRERAARDPQWLDGFDPLPSTYLNGEQWDEDIPERRSKVNGSDPSRPADNTPTPAKRRLLTNAA